ncbi:metal dependent phosphohydrolase [Colletotrichum asianum]
MAPATCLPHIPSVGIVAPASDICQKAFGFCEAKCDTAVLNHAVRAAYWSLITSQKHPTFTDKRFEVDGANVAREFIRDQNTGTEGSWTEARIQRSWDAIALHATPSIARHAAKEVALVQMGVLADFFGPRTHEVAGGPEDLITVDEYHAVMRVFPRAGFDGQGMRKILCHLCRTKADTTFDNWVGDFGLTYGTDGEGENLEEYKQGWEKARSASIWTSALESLVTLDQQD